MGVVAQVQRQLVLSGHRAQAVQHTPVAWGSEDQRGGVQLGDGFVQLQRQGAPGVGIVQPGVDQRQALPAQVVGKVAHGAQEHRNALLGRPHMGGLLRHLGHPHHILRGIKILQR